MLVCIANEGSGKNLWLVMWKVRKYLADGINLSKSENDKP